MNRIISHRIHRNHGILIREISEIRGQIKTASGCNVNDDDDDDYLRDVSVFSEHESHGLHESCTTLRPCWPPG